MLEQNKLQELKKQTEKEIDSIIQQINNICEKNSEKVLKAFQEMRITRATFKFIHRLWNR